MLGMEVIKIEVYEQYWQFWNDFQHTIDRWKFCVKR